MQKIKNDLKKIGFKDPIRAQDLEMGDYFHLTPKGELYRTKSVLFDETNQVCIYAIDVETSHSKEFRLGKSIWLEKGCEPDLNNTNKEVTLHKCIDKLLDYFNSQNWKVVDSSGLVVLGEKIKKGYAFNKFEEPTNTKPKQLSNEQ